MTLDECKALCRTILSEDEPQLDPDQYAAAAESVGASVPEVWLELLPHLGEVIPDLGPKQEHCELLPPGSMASSYARGGWFADQQQPKRWLEFGSNFCGDPYVFDLASPAMPHDAEVVWFDHETMNPVQRWSSIVEFVSSMLSRPPRAT